MKRLRRHQKTLATFLMFVMMSTYAPSAFALTGSSSMPEYRSFEPVATTNMVNMFSGDFTYNIPLLNVPNGYPINLSYHSGEVNNEAQASNVGLGWSINPGAINRMKRSHPDEFEGEPVTYHSRKEASWTASATLGGGLEFFSKENASLLGLDLSGTVRYNNFTGIGKSVNFGIQGPAGLAGLNMSYSAGKFGFSPTFNPAAAFRMMKKRLSKEYKKGSGAPTKEEIKEMAQKRLDSGFEALRSRSKGESKNNKGSVNFGLGGASISHNGNASSGSQFGSGVSLPQSIRLSTPSESYTGFSINLEFAIGTNLLPIPADIEGYVKGSYSRQVTEPSFTERVYGYMHSEKALSDPESIMDYMTERENMFEKRDKIIGYPLPTNDVFSLSGEAMGGSFKAHRREHGVYRPNQVKSKSYEVTAGGDLNIPSGLTPVGLLNIVATFGVDLGGGYNETNISDWGGGQGVDDIGLQFESYDSESNKERFNLRFSGDLYGNLDMALNDSPYRAELIKNGFVSNLSLLTAPSNYEKRVTSGAYVDMHHQGDFTDGDYDYQTHSRSVKILNENGDVLDYEDDREVYGDNSIAEFATTNADGVNYVYGLPIHSRNEKSLSYSVKSTDYDLQKGEGLIAEVSNVNLDVDAKRKLGTESTSPYATQFLLTEITSSDYADRSMDGPTPDDFGTYTRFIYERQAGGQEEWFSYRSPYKDFNYSYGSLSDKKDNMVSMSAGEKEIYYVKQVVSKTHVAIFEYGERSDGHSIPTPRSGREMKDILFPDKNPSASKKLKYLKRIDLYLIDECTDVDGSQSAWEPKSTASPIKTVHFQYEETGSTNELCKGIDNNSVKGGGKLTLKRVWFEYGGKLTSKISPYEFDYNYPKSSEVTYPSVYSYFLTQFGDKYTDEAQNPDYNVLNTGAWGSYRDFATMSDDNAPADLEDYSMGDLARFFPYTHQNPNTTSYDPAAWCMKAIKLPSGGEIHVQYEQHDYTHVQDKKAMVMFPLKSETDTKEKGEKDKRYYLDIKKVGINVNTADIEQELVDQIFEPLRNNKDRMYFNFLYRLLQEGPVDYTTYNSEYIEGYARIKGYGVDGNGIYFYFKNDGNHSGDSYHREISYGNGLAEKPNPNEFPREVCTDFYATNRIGMVSNSGNGLEDNESKEATLKSVIGVLKQLAGLNQRCLRFKPEMSYVRLQLPLVPLQAQSRSQTNYKTTYNDNAVIGKKAEGVRVKRLLMYDEGMGGTGEPVLYGNDYSYTRLSDPSDASKGRVSSGVATNEPGASRRENALVMPMDKEEQSRFNSLFYGRDMYGSDEPLGESLLPGASIGYSKIKVSNIHKGTTSTGYEEHEFFTCKEFPFRAERTSIKQHFKNRIVIGGGVGPVSGSYSRLAPHMTQGYSFVINDMHGKPKSSKKYAHTVPGERPVLIAEQSFEYYLPGEKVKVMDELFHEKEMVIGKESEVLSEMRQIYDVYIGGSAGADFSVGAFTTWPMPLPVPAPIIIPTGLSVNANMREQILKTFVTTKISSYKSLPKRTVTLSDGVRHVTENKVFDIYTGDPVVSYSYDDFGTGVTSQSISGSWVYDNLKPVSDNQYLVKSAKLKEDAKGYYLDFNAVGNCGGLNDLVLGDLYKLEHGNNKALFHASEFDVENNRIYLSKSDQSANPSSLRDETVTMTVQRSGHTNELNAKVGSILYDGTASYKTINPDQTSIDQLISSLNNAYANAGVASERNVEIPSDLTLIDRNGKCKKASSFNTISKATEETDADFLTRLENSENENISIIELENGNKIIRLGRSITGEKVEWYDDGSNSTDLENTPPQSHPLVDGLNYLINDFWTSRFTPSSVSNEFVNALYDTQVLNKGVYVISDETLIDNKLSEWSQYIQDNPEMMTFINGYKEIEYVDQINETLNIKKHDMSHVLVNQEQSIRALLQLRMKVDGVFRTFFDFRGQLEPIYQSNFGISSCSHPVYIENPNWKNIFDFKTDKLCGDYYLSGRYNYNYSYKLWLKSSSRTYNSTFRLFQTSTPKWSPDFHDLTVSGDGTENNPYYQVPKETISSFINNTFESSINEAYGYYFMENGKLMFDYADINNPSGNRQNVDMGISFYGSTPIYTPHDCTELSSTLQNPFFYDNSTGVVMFKSDANDCGVPTCLQICAQEDPSSSLGNVIAASALTLDQTWDYDMDDYADWTATANQDPYENGQRGNWRAKGQYVYRAPLDQNATHGLNFDRGKFNLTLFDWENPMNSTNDNWVETSVTDRYTPNGSAVEDHNNLGIYSTVEYGYKQTLPTLVAQNAHFKTVAFESFEEELYNTGLTTTTSVSHTGDKSLELSKGTEVTVVTNRNSSNETAKGVLIRTWVKNSGDPNHLDGQLEVGITGKAGYDMVRIAKAGEWQLFEGIIPAGELVTGDDIYIRLKSTYLDNVGVAAGQERVYIDDFRMQPLESEMVCYVYDKAQRITAVLDDQHFAMLYQYNAEGLLVRKLKETIEGIKTISETQYNTVGQDRNTIINGGDH